MAENQPNLLGRARTPEEEEAQRLYNPSPLDAPEEAPAQLEPIPQGGLDSPLLPEGAAEETRSTLPVRQEAPKEDEEDKTTALDVVGDIALMGLRGTEGFVESVAGLFGSKWDRKDWSVFGKSKTMVGTFGENIVQFGIGMIPGLGTAGLVGKAAKVAKVAKVAKAAKAGKMAQLAKGNRSFDIKTLRKIAKAKKATRKAIVYGYAGAVSDFVAFKGQEERLSNLLQDVGVDNTFVDYLAYNPEQDPSEMEGRLKNAIEGLFVGGVVGGAIHGVKYLSSVFRKIRRKNELVSKGMEEDDAIDIAQGEFIDEHTANPENAQGLLGINEGVLHENRVREEGAWPQPIRLSDEGGVMDDAPLIGLGDEVPAKPVGVSVGDELPMGRGGKEPKPDKIPIPKLGGKDARKADLSKATEKQLDKFLKEFDMDIPEMHGGVEQKRALARELIEDLEGANKTLNDIRAGMDEATLKDVDEFLGTGELSMKAGRKLLAGIKNNEGLVSLARYMAKRSVALGRAGREAAGREGNAKELYEKIRKNIDDTDGWGMDHAQAQGKLLQARGKLEALQTIYDEQEAVRKLYSFFAQDVQRTADLADAARLNSKLGSSGTKLEYEKAMTEVHSALDKFNAIQELWADYGTTLSMGMLQRKFIYKGMGSGGIKHNTRNLGFDLTSTGKTSVDEQLFQRTARGGRSKKAFLKELREATSGNDMELRLAKLAKSSRNGSSRTLTWFLNALLGSPMTMAVNLVGNGLMKAFRDFEVMAGAMGQFGVTGNTNLLKANIKAVFDFESFTESLKYAKITLKTMEPRSVAGYTAYSDNRFEDLKGGWDFGDSKDPLTIAGNWLGNIVTAPSRVLMAGDELFKQWNYRSYIKTDLAMEALRKGIKDPKEVAAYVHHAFEGHISKEGRFLNEANIYKEAANKADDDGLRFGERDEFINNYMQENFYSNNMRLDDGTIYKTTQQRDMLVERATDWSLINTFTNPAENAGARHIQSFAMGNRWFALVIPFVRTPTNILTFALSRAVPGLGGLHKVGEMGIGRKVGLRAPFRAMKRSTDLSKRYAGIEKGEALGFEHRGAEEAYRKSGFNEPEVIYQKRESGAAAAYHQPGTTRSWTERKRRGHKTVSEPVGPEGVVEVDGDRVRELYDSKEWTKGRDLGEGRVDPLPEDQFKSYEEWEDFVIHHEKAHQHIKRKPGEAKHTYENRVNQAALKAQAFNKESGSGWKKTMQKLYADMPRSEAMAKENANLIAQGESREAAEYIGRITTSAMLMGTIYYNMDKIRERITGKAPKAEAERAAWLADGKQEYSFMLGDKWVSYQRLDPFATIIGLYADMIHYGEAAVDEVEGIFSDEEEKVVGMGVVQKVMAVIGLSFSNNITNKSYVQGISDFIELIREPTEGVQTLPRNIIGGFVPNYLNWSQNLATEEPEILEARKLMDGFMKRLPAFMRPELPETLISSSTLMPRRNFLGEKMTKQNKGPIGGWFPGILGMDARNDISNDIVDLEFGSLGTAFKTKPSTWSGELKTKNYRKRNGGQTAYDRHQELMSETKINGRTLRQALRFIIGTEDYQALLPATEDAIGEAHPRTKALSNIVQFYSQNAKNKVMQEYPELRADYYNLMHRKAAQRGPQ